MPLSRCRIIAADNRCACGIRAALPEHVPSFTLTTVCYTCSPLRDSGQHHETAALPVNCGISTLLLHSFILMCGECLFLPCKD